MDRWVTGVLMVIIAGAPAGMPAAAQTKGERKHTETLLAPFPSAVRDSALISPDGRRIAYIKMTGNQQAVVLSAPMGDTGGPATGAPVAPVEEKSYDRIAGLTFSPNSQWRAYAATAGGKWRIVINGREQPASERVGPPLFSPNSKRLVYTALQADGEHVAVVEVPKGSGPPYERIFEGQIVFSPDSQRLAYGVRQQGKWHLVVDGQQLGPYDFLGSASGIRFSPDGSRLAFAALVGKKWCVVLDGKPQRTFDNLGQLAFSPDGKRLAYAALEGDKWRVVVEGAEPQQPPKTCDAIGEGTLAWSPDGTRLAFAAQSGKNWLVGGLSQFSRSENGTVPFRTVESKPYAGIAEMRFSPNSKLLAYVAKAEAGEMVVLGDRPGRIFDRVGGGTLVFSADSAHLGYIARWGRASFVVVDGKRNPRYDMVGYLTFAPERGRYVYAATQGGRVFTVVDDQPSAHRYEAIWTVPQARFVFDGRKRFHYLAAKEGNIYLVEEEVP